MNGVLCRGVLPNDRQSSLSYMIAVRMLGVSQLRVAATSVTLMLEQRTACLTSCAA